MQQPPSRKASKRNRVLLLLFFVVSCSGDSARNRYLLAEKFWNQGRYAAAVSEFEKVIQKDPKSKLGLLALYRAAVTQALYLSQYSEAVKKFYTFIESSGDTPTSWDAQKQIGEIFFTKTEQYDQANQHYRALLKLKPRATDAPEFLFRVGKSHFFQWQFDDAVKAYKELIKRYEKTKWAEKAAYEIGVTYFTRGEQQPPDKDPGKEAYQEAIDSFQQFLKNYPNSQWVAEAKFGIANCLEEMDQLDAAYYQYEALKSTYPSPRVIEIKLIRIKERKEQRSR